MGIKIFLFLKFVHRQEKFIIIGDRQTDKQKYSRYRVVVVLIKGFSEEGRGQWTINRTSNQCFIRNKFSFFGPKILGSIGWFNLVVANLKKG